MEGVLEGAIRYMGKDVHGFISLPFSRNWGHMCVDTFFSGLLPAWEPVIGLVRVLFLLGSLINDVQS